MAEVNQLKRELELTREKVSALEVTSGQYKVFGETLERVHHSLERVHSRMDGLEQKLARLEGFEQGRRSREIGQGDR